MVPEIARELIKEQNEINGEALPWKNKEMYKSIMFDRSIRSYEQFDKKKNKENFIFFDRGFLDTICYAELIQSEITEQMKSYAESWRYNKSIFMLPPWREIYKTDSERKQNWDEAVITFQKMTETYKNYGYTIIEIPKKPINERAEFILNIITENDNT
ncbi:AAA family ATPase [Winogradskyella wichelsiae]|uniref:AAA family ATPase n=1 Tax=Winogradskyella wichelsiae TaxID=2697007 RepID=UPI00293BC186|nr:AAA family ATPase [Winogradskyella wichelsiae]